MSFLFKSAAKKVPGKKSVAVIANYNSCELGVALTKKFEQNFETMVLVSPNHPKQVNCDSDTFFTGFMNSQEDRNRLVAFLQEQNFEISRLIYNQPYMLEPTEKDK